MSQLYLDDHSKALVAAHLAQHTRYQPYPDLLDLALGVLGRVARDRRNGVDPAATRALVVRLPSYGGLVRFTWNGAGEVTVGEVYDHLKLEAML